ncbi:MAG: hypothetical protein J0H11_13360 [Rhizobiales bacterium]|nr:hypothetical protein [Hyphomicrobiales bacterium]
MKFDDLRSIAHNIADSLASGIGLMIGVYHFDVFSEAAASPEGFILVDFVSGTSSGAQPSALLARVIALYGQALDPHCQRHGTRADAFRELKCRYSADHLGVRFLVTVEDQNGRRIVDEYIGRPGRRALTIDPMGRLRSKRSPSTPPPKARREYGQG